MALQPEIFDICRACLSTEDLLMLSEDILEKYPLQIKLSVEDNLPRQICSPCYTKCKEWDTFKMMCIENEQYWQTCLEGTNLIEISSESDGPRDASVVIFEGAEDKVEYVLTDEKSGGSKQDMDIIDWNDLNLNVDVKCPLCPRSSKWSTLFNQHLQDHLSTDTVEFPGGGVGCPKCEEGYQSKESLLRHIYSHLDCSFGCPKCEAAFDFPNDLMDHARQKCFKVSYEIILEDLGCKICHTTFVSTSELTDHMKDHTTSTGASSKTTIECDFCGKVFKQYAYLERHRIRHTSDRPHKCRQCDQTFILERELNEHVKSHDPANHIYVCPVCGPTKRYFLKRALKAHIDRNHRIRVRNFSCTLCDKRFYDATSLKKHSNSHTGSKPFNCLECEQKFSRMDHMKVHMARQHKARVSKPN